MVLEKVPYYPQQDHYCAVASLKSVYEYWGKEISYTDLIKSVYVPKKRGAFGVELAADARRRGFMPFVVKADNQKIENLLKNGFAPIVLLNLSFEFLPVWHYGVVYGFDKQEGVFLLRSRKAEEKIKFGAFAKMHSRADNWTIVISPPSRVPPLKKDLLLKGLISLEKSGRYETIKEFFRYNPGLKKEELFRFSYANALFYSKDFNEAAKEYAKIDSPFAMNNLSLALAKEGRCEKAVETLRKASVRYRGYEKLFEKTQIEISKECQNYLQKGKN